MTPVPRPPGVRPEAKESSHEQRVIDARPLSFSAMPLVVEMADKRYGLGTSKLEEIQIERIGWTDDVLV